MPIKTALIQMLVLPGAKERNLNHARELVGQAAQRGAQLVVLPEAMTLGWTDPSALTEADEIPGGLSCRTLADTARENQVYLCSGLIERSGDLIFNSAVLIDPAGHVVLHHRKINELEIAHNLYAQGQALKVVSTPLGRIGLMICSDGFAAGQCVSRALGYLGADLILSPSSWAVPHDHDQQKEPYGKLWLDNYIPVARDFQLWIVAVSNVGPIRAGPWQGRKCIGCSLAINPDGQRILEGPYGEAAETILELKIKLRPRVARGDGWARRLAQTERPKPQARDADQLLMFREEPVELHLADGRSLRRSQEYIPKRRPFPSGTPPRSRRP